MKNSDRLQGTDGVRGVARPSTDPKLQGLDPREVFRHQGILTEQFLELYAYAHVMDLRRKGRLNPSGEVVIGWDPRDTVGTFTAAAVRGIRKGGARALVVGVLPTPAVILYLHYRRAASALMITASHNPADQNGVKLFLGPLGLKPLPADDRSLTALIDSLDCQAMNSLQEVGGLEMAREEALEIFQAFSLDSRNTWIEDKKTLQELLLVVDPAWGAFSGIAAHAFRSLGAAEVIEVNGSLGSDVNLDSGVAQLEGTDQIDARLRSSAGRDFENNTALRELFRLGRKNRSTCASGKRRVAAAVFDADGDRFYGILYDPFQDRALILSGDESAYHQARYLIRRFPDRYQGSWYLNTVESDLNVSRAAARLGYRTGLTGVGDKWLLWRAYLFQLSTRLNRHGQPKLAPPKHENRFLESPDIFTVKSLGRDKDTADLRRVLMDLSDLTQAEAFALCELYDTLEGLGKEEDGSAPSTEFGLANEESGHLLTQGILTLPEGGSVPVYTGNGLKGALNTLVALLALESEAVSPEGMERLHHPFTPGFKRTYYVYYTDKGRIHPGDKVRSALDGMLEGACQRTLRKAETLSLYPFPEEPEMLYFRVIEENEPRAGVFVRNSGTEEKTAIYLRGVQEDEERLIGIGEETSRFLLTRMKNSGSPHAQAERAILERLQDQPNGLSEKQLKDLSLELPFPRLVREMEKQGLVEREDHLWRLTSLGKWFLSESVLL